MIRLKTFYVLFAIEVSTRRVHLAGVTSNPDSARVRRPANVRFFLHDRNAKFSGPFDVQDGGCAGHEDSGSGPRANAYAERWVGTLRRECLDHVLILGRRHIERTLWTT